MSPVTQIQLAALEKAKTEKEAHGEFESECPGYCGARFLLDLLTGIVAALVVDPPSARAFDALTIDDRGSALTFFATGTQRTPKAGSP
jgi:hypothetical protein